MKFATTIECVCDIEEADNITKAMMPEIESHKNERATIEIIKKKKKLNFIIKSNDLASLRASFNSVTKLLSVYKEIKNVK